MTALEQLETTVEGLGLKAVQARLLKTEADARRSRYLRARLQLAHLPYVKTFEQFDFSFQPSIDERQVRELQTLRFIHDASNPIFLGPPAPDTYCSPR